MIYRWSLAYEILRTMDFVMGQRVEERCIRSTW